MGILDKFLKPKKQTFPLKCIDCKQCKTHIDCSGGNYSDHEKGILSMFSERIPDYCYMTKKKIQNKNQSCIIPMHEDSKINEAFICDNEIIHHQYQLSDAGIPVFVSLSGRKYHTKDCTQIKGRRFLTSLGTACRLGYQPCSKCNPPE